MGKKETLDWRYSSVVEHLPSTSEALGSISDSTKISIIPVYMGGVQIAPKFTVIYLTHNLDYYKSQQVRYGGTPLKSQDFSG